MLLLDQPVLCSVSNGPDALGLKIPEATFFWQLEVWRVVRRSLRDRVVDLFCLILDFEASIRNLLADGFFQAASVAML